MNNSPTKKKKKKKNVQFSANAFWNEYSLNDTLHQYFPRVPQEVARGSAKSLKDTILHSLFQGACYVSIYISFFYLSVYLSPFILL